MDISMFIAKLIGLIYLAFGLGMYLSKDYYKREVERMIGNSGFILFGAFLALTFGLFIVEFHNIWECSYRGVITLIGWMGILKGVMLLMWPDSKDRFERILKPDFLHRWIAPLVVIFGAYLLYFGFGLGL